MTALLLTITALAVIAAAVVLARLHAARATLEDVAAPVVELAVIDHAPETFSHFAEEDFVYVTPRLVEHEPQRPAPAPSTSVDNAMAVAIPDRSSPFAAPILRSSKIALPDDGAEIDFFGTGVSSEPSRQYLASPGGSATPSPLTHRAS